MFDWKVIKSFAQENTSYNTPFHLVLVCGGKHQRSHPRVIAYVNIVDVCNNYYWVFFLTKKSHIYEVSFQLKKMMELHNECLLKCIQTDNALEFKRLASMLKNYGIVHHFFCLYNHQ